MKLILAANLLLFLITVLPTLLHQFQTILGIVRTAIRDAIANIQNYQGLASGPISFCADPTPECRDGNKTPVMIEYTKGGKDFVTKVLGTITFKPNHGL